MQQILLGVDRGGFEEAVIRMLILMAELCGTVRRDRLERSAKVLGHDEPFASLGAEKRAALIHEQSVIAEFEPDLAIKTLPDLLPDMEERKRAIGVIEFIAGAVEEMEPSTIQLVQRFHSVLGLPGLALPAPTQDPLKVSATAAKDDLSDVMTTIAPAVEAPKVGDALEAVKPKGTWQGARSGRVVRFADRKVAAVGNDGRRSVDRKATMVRRLFGESGRRL